MRKLFIFLPLVIFSFFCHSQNQVPQKRLKVFIDCSNTWCDFSYIKTEINIVDFLLDYQAADLHILITEQSTGSGGSEYQMIYFGQNQFKNQSDTLRFNTSPDATDFEKREIFIKYLKLGLAPFVAKTASVSGVNIIMKQENSSVVKKETTDTYDPWNYWVMRVNANGNFNADAVYKSFRYSSGFSVNRTTDKLKVNFGIYASKNKTTYEYEVPTGYEKYTVDNNDYGINHYLVKSLTDHWSYGYEAALSSSTFSNNQRRLYFRTGIEYDIYPYKDVNTKFFTINYTLDIRKNKYYDTTIYGKSEEVLTGQGTEVNLSFNQKWGSANLGASYHNYFNNWNYYNIGIHTYVSVRISGGLSFNVSVYGELTRDQVYLPKGDATEQEVLTRKRQLASDYNYYTSFGFSYRFGSKLSNFVNPRFEGNSGGVYFY